MIIINIRNGKFFGVIASVFLLVLVVCFSYSYAKTNNPKLKMGGTLLKKVCEIPASNINVSQIDPEKYFRPSKLPIINTKPFDYKFFDKLYQSDPSKVVLPAELLKSPEDTLINYFSVLREAENLTKNMTGGCGTIGNAKEPYPIAYNFFTEGYKKKVDFKTYLKSFEGIAHINLIKLHKVPSEADYPNSTRYFVEIETIEGSSKDSTYFAYYYGFANIIEEENKYKISDLEYVGEDFLCAAYHGWIHNAELSVDIRYGDWCSLIKERFPTKQDGYVKKIYFKGTDGNDYLIEFFQLTNDTDIEIAQYIKDKDGTWKLIKIDPTKCIKND